jgi:hypothetical protein
MKRMFAYCLLSALMAVTAAAADVTGRWTGNLAVDNHDPETFTLLLKQEGAAIAGSVGATDGDQLPLTAGKIDGNRITLEVKHNEDRSLKIELILDGDQMSGNLTATRRGRTTVAKLALTRVKQ